MMTDLVFLFCLAELFLRIPSADAIGLGPCWASLLVPDDWTDAGAAHSDEAGLQAVVVALRCP